MNNTRHEGGTLPDNVGASVQIVNCGKEMLITRPARSRKQHPNMQLWYCHP